MLRTMTSVKYRLEENIIALVDARIQAILLELLSMEEPTFKLNSFAEAAHRHESCLSPNHNELRILTQ